MAAWQATHLPKDPGDTGHAQGWADPATDDAGWKSMELPRHWQREGLQFSGSLWYRRSVNVPAAGAGKDLVLSLGALDKSDITWFNNERVGGLSHLEREDSWCTPREYRIPGRLVRPGRNLVAVRVFSHIYAGGFGGIPAEMWLAPAGTPETERLPLYGPWRYRVEHDLGRTQPPPAPPLLRGEGNPNSPYILYGSMIAPLVPYGLRGAIWYQGESNAGRPEEYRRLFPAMIEDWREAWGLGAFPFYFVQLASYNAGSEKEGRCFWAELREAQTLTLSLPATGMAVTIDIGEANDIHPKNKQDVGRRLARIARAQIYGETELVFSGPLFRTAKREQDALRLRFDHAAGLQTSDGDAPRGFTLAGADNVFLPATAVIDGETVVVRRAGLAAPAAARYAWADVPDGNLVNGERLPASPFRTDGPAR